MSKMESKIFEAALRAHPQPDEGDKLARRRKRMFLLLGGLLLKAGVGYAVYEYTSAARYVSTDNAYTAAETAQVTPAVSGIVRAVRVTDTQTVRRGDIVVVLDDVDARLAVAQAEAELDRARRRVRGYAATDDSLKAQIAASASEAQRAHAQLISAEADLARAAIDLERRQSLASSGSVSGDELTRAHNAYATAEAGVAAARAQAKQALASHDAAVGSRDANAAQIRGVAEDDNPEVTLARARLDQARVNLGRTVIRAPVDGVVAKRTVQVGQQVQPGASLLSVVPVAQVHVDANFKEGQLDRVRVGQPVKVVSDLYGDDVVYRGVVAGLAGGTGATFATIPAQNATGNWIKVVQRVPVRILLDAGELRDRPLQIGLSMTATIDTQTAKTTAQSAPAIRVAGR